MISVRFLHWWPGLIPKQSFIYQLLKKSLECDITVVSDTKAKVDIEAHSVFTRSRLYREALQFELQLERQQQSDLVDCINSIELQRNLRAPLTLRYCRQLGAEHLHNAFSAPMEHIVNL